MDQCVTVERELEKVLHKFSGYGQLCERGLEELIDYTGGLKHEILQSHGQDAELSGTLSLVLTQCCKRIKDTVQKLASDHKDIHSSVSRVGKAIDKIGERNEWRGEGPHYNQKRRAGSRDILWTGGPCTENLLDPGED